MNNSKSRYLRILLVPFLVKTFVTVLFFLVLEIFSFSCNAQEIEIKFSHLSVAEGLSQSGVRAILQDKTGFMWFGTQDGLNRYDGYQFTVYRNQPGNPNTLSNNYITALCEDKAGNIWIGTRGGGLNKFDPVLQKYTVYRHNPQSPDSTNNVGGNNISVILLDQTNNLWIGTKDGGLTHYNVDEDRFTIYRPEKNNPNSLSGLDVTAIFQDKDGKLWIGTQNAGLNKFDPIKKEFTLFQHQENNPNSLSKNSVWSIYQDDQEMLWIGTYEGGLNKLDLKTNTFTTYLADPNNPNSISHNTISVIRADRRGVLWIGTYGGGLCRYDTKTFTSYIPDPNSTTSLSAKVVYSIYEDRTGNIWIGTYNGGINKYNPNIKPFTTYRNNPNNPNSLSYNDVQAIYQDSKGFLWIGTYGGGLNCYDPGKKNFTTYRYNATTKNALTNDQIRAISGDKAGNIWIGTFGGGLNRYNPETKSFTAYHNNPKLPNSLSQDFIWSTYVDSEGTLWIGTRDNGLNRYNPQTDDFTVYRHNDKLSNSLSHNWIYKIYQDSSNFMWIGTYGGGLNKFDPKTETFTTYRNNPDKNNSLSSNLVLSIYQDKEGTLWIGTASGLNKFEPQTQTFQVIREKDGLPNDTIYGILEDDNNNLWLSTNNGICKFNPKTRKFRKYDLSDGLQSNEFNAACYKSKNGEMFFGGINGLNRFFPDKIVDNPNIPSIVITEFKIFDKPFPIAEKKTLSLSYHENFFSFEFAALDYSAPEKNQYAYQMEGVSKAWVYSGHRRYVSYTNLDAGEYTFKVKGSNNDGIWNENATTIKITIIPPIWKTWWAYLLYIVLIVGSSISIVQYRLLVLKRQNALLEAKVSERTQELSDRNQALIDSEVKIKLQADELVKKNLALDKKFNELAKKNEELIASQKQAARIFSALAEALPGTVLDGKYQLDKKIGSGGFGAVFQATHLALNRAVAVKVFRPTPGNDTSESLVRFRLEGVSAIRVNHPNAVSVLDSGISLEGIAYLVMELLEGHTLKREISQQSILPIKRAAEILLPVCDVLDKAHSMGIIHRDIKPDNIFLHKNLADEIVKVVDFGIAKLIDETFEFDEDMQNLTATGGLIGTPVYMSPERLQNLPYDGKSDIYSLGVVFYEMLCGRPPFFPQSNSTYDIFMVIQNHINDLPPNPSKINPSISLEIEALILKTLAKDPILRPSAKELAQELAILFNINLSNVQSTNSINTGNLKIATQPKVDLEAATVTFTPKILDPNLAITESTEPNSIAESNINLNEVKIVKN